jgi:hypothetical protein
MDGCNWETSWREYVVVPGWSYGLWPLDEIWSYGPVLDVEVDRPPLGIGITHRRQWYQRGASMTEKFNGVDHGMDI